MVHNSDVFMLICIVWGLSGQPTTEKMPLGLSCRRDQWGVHAFKRRWFLQSGPFLLLTACAAEIWIQIHHYNEIMLMNVMQVNGVALIFNVGWITKSLLEWLKKWMDRFTAPCQSSHFTGHLDCSQVTQHIKETFKRLLLHSLGRETVQWRLQWWAKTNSSHLCVP